MLALTDALNTNDKRASLADRGNAFTFTFSNFQLLSGDFAKLKYNDNKKKSV